MTTTARRDYALGNAPEEYERLRGQALMWEKDLRRVLDTVGLGRGARCLDAGCGPGEGMRVLAERVGESGVVVGADIDARAGAYAVGTLHAEGHRQCRFVEHDVTSEEPVPGGPYDVVLARWLLFHLPSAAVVRRLWDSLAAGGVLLVQDYDLRTVAQASAALASLDETTRVIEASFRAAGAQPFVGLTLPLLFAEAQVGPPDGTDVAGRLIPLAASQPMLEQLTRSLLPVALAHDITTEDLAEATLAELASDAVRLPQEPVLWPVLVSAWRRKPA